MEPNLFDQYDKMIKKEVDTRNFTHLIKTNPKLKEELFFLSEEMNSFYPNPTHLQRLKYIFGEQKITFCKCGNPLLWRNFFKGYNKTCGNKKCVSEKNVQSVKDYYLENYGVTHLFQTEGFKSKFKEKSIEKYGVDNPWKSKEVIEKIKKSNFEKFGETSWMKVQENKDRVSKNLSIKNMRERIKRIEEVNLDIEIKSSDFKKGEIEIFCNKCSDKSKFSYSFFNKRVKIGETPCLVCNPPLYSESRGEQELYDFISEIYDGKIIRHDRKVLGGKEIDIYLPDLNIAFEFEGTYWHSEIFKNKNENLNKKNLIQEKGIKTFNVWEDNWHYKKEIIKSRILNVFEKSEIIFARKCEIKEISPKEEKEFMEENHIQGYVPSKVKIGLFFEKNLVSVMTFGSNRKSLGNKSKEGEYELLRFSNKLGISVLGGASKIYSYFIKKYSPLKVISYQDNSWNTGDLYKNLGFTQIEKAKPNYFWCKGNIRFHRFNFRKDKLVKEGFDPNKTEYEIMSERKYYRLWDFGNLKWEWKQKNQE